MLTRFDCRLCAVLGCSMLLLAGCGGLQEVWEGPGAKQFRPQAIAVLPPMASQYDNSMVMHTNNQGDSYRMLAHPGACVIPAALTTAELDGRSGKEFIAGVVAGYEVECRIAGDFIPSTQAQGFRTSPVYGVFGATAAAAKVQGLNEDQAVNALGWATSFAAASQRPRVAASRPRGRDAEPKQASDTG